MPVGDRVVTNDLDLPSALGCVAVSEIASGVWVITKAANEVQDMSALRATLRHGI
jgi:hypothetical protein